MRTSEIDDKNFYERASEGTVTGEEIQLKIDSLIHQAQMTTNEELKEFYEEGASNLLELISTYNLEVKVHPENEALQNLKNHISMGTRTEEEIQPEIDLRRDMVNIVKDENLKSFNENYALALEKATIDGDLTSEEYLGITASTTEAGIIKYPEYEYIPESSKEAARNLLKEAGVPDSDEATLIGITKIIELEEQSLRAQQNVPQNDAPISDKEAPISDKIDSMPKQDP